MPRGDGLQMVEDCLTCKMRSQEFFCALPDRVLWQFQKIKATSIKPTGSILFLEGAQPDGVYMLCHGRVELSVKTEGGEAVVIRNSQPGELLGLHACVSGTSNDVTARVAEITQVNFAPRTDFLRFLQQHGEACLRAARQLSQRCHGAYSLVRSFEISHTAAERVARLLLELETHASRNGTAESRRKINTTPEQIAATIGVSHEQVCNVLQDFAERGLATLNGKELEIHNRTEMEGLGRHKE